MPEELWMEFCDFVQELVIKTIPKKKKGKKARWLFEKALQIAEKTVSTPPPRALVLAELWPCESCRGRSWLEPRVWGAAWGTEEHELGVVQRGPGGVLTCWLPLALPEPVLHV